MRKSRTARGLAAATAAVTTAALIATSTAGVAEAKPQAKPSATQASKKFEKAVTVKGVQQHLKAFQKIADDNDGTRASGTPGYQASRDYVVKKLRAAGYKPTVQAFDFAFFQENSPGELSRTTPAPRAFAIDDEFDVMDYSGSGTAQAPVTVVDTDLTPSTTTTSGCEAGDFAGFPDGNVALLQRGTCSFAIKAANAEEAGASAALIFNRGTTDETVTPLPSIPTSAAPGLPGPTAPAPTTTSAAPTPTATTTEPVPTTPAPTPTSSTTEPTPTQTTPAPTPTSSTTEPTPTQTTPAPTTPTPSDTPTGVLVTPEAPRFADHCVPGNGIVHLPRTTGVRYDWDRRVGLITTTVVVDATPEAGYAFAAGTTSRWTRVYLGICGNG